MENALLEIKKEPTDDPTTNLVEVDLQDELLISNNSEDVGSKQIIATKQTDRKRLRKKLYRIHVDPNCICQLCKKVCLSPEDLEMHCEHIHIKKNFKDITISKDAFDTAQYVYKRFKCKLCKYKCCNRPAIVKHIKTSHFDIKQEHCETRSETFDNLVTLDSHKCTHTSEKPYKCTKQDSPLSNDFNSTNLSEIIKQEEYLILDDPEIEIKENSSLVCLLNENNLKTELKTKQTKRKSVEITNEANYVILNKIYRCTLCPFGTKDISNIKSHFKAHNISTVSEAPYTVAGKEMYTNLKDYLYEFCDTFYRCKVCAFNCLDHKLIKQHVDDFHINVTSRCEVCTKFYVSSVVLKVLYGDLIKSQYKCLKCEYTSFGPLTNHMESHPNICLKCEVTSRCAVCNTLFESSTVLTLHHCGRIRKQYKCLTCEYTSFEPLTNHMESHPNKCFKCNVTSSELRSMRKQDCYTYNIFCSLCSFKCKSSSWIDHVKCHPEKKPRPIYIAKNAQYVYEHVEKHYQCNLCEFNECKHLTANVPVNREHLQKRFQCNLCEFNHFNHPKMKTHVKDVHVTIGDHQCKFCGKRFETSVILLTHLRTHW